MAERPNSPPEDIVRKERFQPGRFIGTVEVVEDNAFRERLEYLRARSTELNKLLQRKLEEAGFPYYSWNKSFGGKKSPVEYPKIMRLAVLLRPEFYHSAEEKTRETRYSTGDEQLTIFLHLKSDNTIQMARAHRGYQQAAYMVYFEDSVMLDLLKPGKEKERESVERCIREENHGALADFIMDRITPPKDDRPPTSAQRSTEIFMRAYSIGSLRKARKYFADQEVVLYQSPEIIRNLGKVAIMSVLEKVLLRRIGKRNKIADIKRMLKDEAMELLDVQVKRHHRPGPLSSFIPNADIFVEQTVAKLIKAYKPRILGWEK